MNITREIPEFLHSRAPGVDYVTIERWIWAALFAFYIVGDIATTIISMEIGGTESSGAALAFLDALGYAGLFVHKLVLLAGIVAAAYVLTLCARVMDVDASPFRSLVIFMFAARGVLLVTWNSYVIYLLLTGSGYAVSPF